MKASKFLAQYKIVHIVEPDNPTHDGLGKPLFRVTFLLPARYGSRTVDMTYGAALDDDEDTVSGEIAEVFYRMAEAARYGESYELLLDDFGSDVGITREQWEQGQKELRRRCREWLPDDGMWEEFLGVEIDDDGTDAHASQHR